MQGGILLNAVILKRIAVLQLLSCENQPLLVGRETLLVLYLGFDVLDAVGRLYLQYDVLAAKHLYEDLHGARLYCKEKGKRQANRYGQKTSVFSHTPAASTETVKVTVPL